MKRRRPRPDEPPAELIWCIRCRKVRGDHRGWYGAQCQCDVPTSTVSIGHSIPGPLPSPPKRG